MDPLEADDPRQVGRYRLLARLGGGGMGQVYLGETQGHRKVAIKLIRREYARDADFRLRFTWEVAAAREVGGLHTALVFDADLKGEPPWMATAYIPGPSLAAKVREQGPLDGEAVSDLGAALAEGLSAIHACGIIHRDLKPSNIIMAEDGPRIIDFGIAKRASATTITPSGVPIGTVQYMSPEHLGAGDIGTASDVFSMGAVLAFAATGRAPFDAPEDTAVIGRILAQPPTLGPLAPPLCDVIRACLAKDPADRPLLDELLAYFSATGSAPGPPPANGTSEWPLTVPGTLRNQPPGPAGAPPTITVPAGARRPAAGHPEGLVPGPAGEQGPELPDGADQYPAAGEDPDPPSEWPTDWRFAGLVYEAPSAGPGDPVLRDEFDEPAPYRDLGGLGGLTMEEPGEAMGVRLEVPPPAAAPLAEAGWNEPVTPLSPAAGGTEESSQQSFGRNLVSRRGGEPAARDQPRVRVRDLPPDVLLRLWRLRVFLMIVVFLVFFIITRNWAIALSLMVIAGIIDAFVRSRNAALYVNGAVHPGARKRTRRQLARIRRDGYFTLDAASIPDSREVIDHLVIGPTGVYAIDSEKWDPKLPIKTWNGKKLYHGPETKRDRLVHAVWEAARASEVLSGALGTGIEVRPVLAVYGPKIPWEIATIRDVDVFNGWALPKYLRRRDRVRGATRLTREEIRVIYDTAARMLPPSQSPANDGGLLRS